MKLLTKFWMKTPVGKLEFNRVRDLTWEMYGTKGGIETQRVQILLPDVRADEVTRVFGWPKEFRPYGEVHEEVGEPKAVKKVQPLVTLHGMGHVWGTTIGDDTLIFKSKEDLDAYLEQQREKGVKL